MYTWWAYWGDRKRRWDFYRISIDAQYFRAWTYYGPTLTYACLRRRFDRWRVDYSLARFRGRAITRAIFKFLRSSWKSRNLARKSRGNATTPWTSRIIFKIAFKPWKRSQFFSNVILTSATLKFDNSSLDPAFRPCQFFFLLSVCSRWVSWYRVRLSTVQAGLRE